jgi:hypothetical protein
MRDALIPIISDYDYDSPSFPSSPDANPSDWNSDSQPEDISDRQVETAVDMGQAIAFAFPLAMEYDLHDQREALDDGLSGDESSYSDASSNYEELTDPEFVVQVIEAEVRGKQEEEEYEESVEDYDWDGRDEPDAGSENEADSDYEFDGDENSNPEEEPEEVKVETKMALENITETGIPVPSLLIPQRTRQTLSELGKTALVLNKKYKLRDQHLWRQKELEESLRQIQRQLLEVEADLETAKDEIQTEQSNQLYCLVASGLSPTFFELYQNFCESLQPEHGLRDGFSIACHLSHNGSYVLYDPEFELFKRFVEMDYSTCNFRCEAKAVDTVIDDCLDSNRIVEFWPVSSPEASTGDEETWGQLHVSYFVMLYHSRCQKLTLQSLNFTGMLLELLVMDRRLRWRCW